MRALGQQTAASAQTAWSEVDPASVAASWSARLPAVVAVLTTAQLAAAGLAAPYVGAVAASSTALSVAAFAGMASDGRPLASLLFSPAVTVLRALKAGATPPRAMASGLATLDMIVRTQVGDADRVATGVAMVASPGIIGYERVVHLPACGRCIVLAGRVYRWSEGFLRHPRCDCTMLPVTRAQHREENLSNHPRALFEAMSPEDQRKAFTVDGARAIRDGADIGQVVNARSGMSTANVGGRQIATTTTGTTRRAIAGQRLSERFGSTVVSEFTRTRVGGGTERVRLRGSRAPRLLPETIYQVAEDREHAIRLLRLHGYIL